MSTVEKATECAACGNRFDQPRSGKREFCRDECQKAGRAFCKGGCGTPLIQTTGKGQRKVWCSEKCRNIYRRIGLVSRFIIEEQTRNTCICGCGRSITQPKSTGRKKKFYENACMKRYYRTGKRKQSMLEEWGMYAPETRKALREVQQFMGMGAAKRFATAIDREYTLRQK